VQAALAIAASRTRSIRWGEYFSRHQRLSARQTSLAQEAGAALGAQAGEERIRKVVTAAGFTRFRRAAETPFDLVFEARP